jgi:predicted nucleic acid-binding protein
VALTHLLDTSVVTRLHHRAVRDVVEPLVLSGQVGRPAIVDLELGYGARNVAEWDAVADALKPFAAVETTSAHFVRALQVQRLLAGRSQRGRKIPDLLIAAAAEEAGLTVLHYDADFDRIATVTGQRCEWVVPAGTVD